jgi:hypothetical protein
MRTLLATTVCFLLALGANIGRGTEATATGTPTPYSDPEGTILGPALSAVLGIIGDEAPSDADLAGRKGHDDEAFHFDLGLDHRPILGGDYQSLSQVTLAAHVMMDDFNSVGVTVGAGPVRLKRGSFTDSVAYQPFIAGIGLVGRHYFTKQKTFLQPYVTASVSEILLGWDYRRSVVPDGDRSYYLNGFDGYAGCGLSIRALKRLRIFGEFGGGGVTLYDNSTEDKINRTAFSDFGYVAVKGGLHFVF